MSYRNTRKAFALRRAVAGLLLAACALLPVPAGPASAATCSAEENVVCTDVGAVRGVREGQTVGFKGIPYAKPPVAALRWRPPEPPAAWDGVRDGSRTGPMCPQIVGGKVVGDEDCLTLNIWAPARPAERPRAVMVWLTGGGNHSLSGQGSPGFGGVTYDGEVLAGRGDVIFVSFNVRLGVLGFLAHPALSAERPERVSGNYASLDQIAMLNWLNRNIAAFGGDPSRVFLFGTSAGGGNICALMTSPMTKGLFHGAAMQSSVPAACELQTLAEVERGTGARVVKAAGCDQAGDVAGCLRTKSVEEIVSAVPGTFGIFPRIYGPNVDGHVFPDQPIKLIAAKRHHAMPAIVGGTADETIAVRERGRAGHGRGDLRGRGREGVRSRGARRDPRPLPRGVVRGAAAGLRAADDRRLFHLRQPSRRQRARGGAGAAGVPLPLHAPPGERPGGERQWLGPHGRASLFLRMAGKVPSERGGSRGPGCSRRLLDAHGQGRRPERRWRPELAGGREGRGLLPGDREACRRRPRSGCRPVRFLGRGRASLASSLTGRAQEDAQHSRGVAAEPVGRARYSFPSGASLSGPSSGGQSRRRR